MYLMTFSGVVPPVVYVLDAIRNPCFPPYVGYMLSRQCADDTPGYYSMPSWSLIEILEKVVISFITYITWSSLFPGGLFQMSLEYVGERHCFLVNIAKFGK